MESENEPGEYIETFFADTVFWLKEMQIHIAAEGLQAWHASAGECLSIVRINEKIRTREKRKKIYKKTESWKTNGGIRQAAAQTQIPSI